MFIFEIVLGFLCVIFYLWIGIFIGKNYGSFENFVLCCLESLKKRMNK